MNKLLISILTMAVPALAGMAIVPVTEQNAGKGKIAIQKTPKPAKVAAPSTNQNTFFEGFEDRPYGFTQSAREWLPEGWQDISKSGESTSGHNLTWQTIDNENKNAAGPVIDPYAYEGEVFAYIMADVAYPGHHDLHVQDEWLITPSVTPVNEDWLYFKLYYRPGWVLLNRDNNDFTGQNNTLEIYISEDDGQNWTRIWSLIDDEIKTKYSDDDLRADLITRNRDYEPIYVNIKPYLGKQVKFAFRYFGNLGLPMAIDNVAVGVPMPVSSYVVPGAALRQGISPMGEYPVEPRLYIPSGTELSWVNTSIDVMRNEWSYSDASGAIQKSDVFNLVTPAYEFGSEHATPSLQGFFESRESEIFQSRFAKMQAGGSFIGSDDQGYTGEFGTCNYDITDPTHRVMVSPRHIAFGPEVDENWETLLGRLPETLDIDGILNFYPVEKGHPFGFDYVEMMARVEEDFDDDAVMYARVFATDDNGAPIALIGQTEIKGSDMPKANGEFTMLRFNFDVPVYANSDFFVLITNPCQFGGEVYFKEGNHISFAYLASADDNIVGNSFLYMWMYDETTGWLEQFGNLNSYPSTGGHFAGMLMNIGSSYSWMERQDAVEIDLPLEGGEAEFQVKAFHKPEKMALTFDGIFKPEWIDYTIEAAAEPDVYNVKLNIGTNPYDVAIETPLMLMSPGSYITVPFSQPANPASVSDAIAGTAVKVAVEGDNIVVTGGKGTVQVFDISGMAVASAELNGARTVIPAAHLAKGVYIVRPGNAKACKIVK
ncbi:MAG: T9SS type A sorting domain-containing protein [Muribaculaceae bacterium]|nr:T9SS type A sorting domain-containing protein [Muribaculaceae bacterium]